MKKSKQLLKFILIAGISCSPFYKISAGDKVALEEPAPLMMFEAEEKRDGDLHVNEQKDDQDVSVAAMTELQNDQISSEQRELTLENFLQACQDAPESTRFIVEKDARGNFVICPREALATNVQQENGENKKTIEALRDVLKKRHPPEIVQQLLTENGLRPSAKKYPSLSASILYKLLAQSERLPKLKSAEEIAQYFDDDVLLSLRGQMNHAQMKLNQFQKSRACVDGHVQEWFQHQIDVAYFQIARWRGVQMRFDEVLKVAHKNQKRCNFQERHNIRTILDIEPLGSSEFMEQIEQANRAHAVLDDYIANQSDDVERDAAIACQQWKIVIDQAKEYKRLLKKNIKKLQYELQYLEQSYQYYQKREQTLQYEISTKRSEASQVWNRCLGKLDEVLKIFFQDAYHKLSTGRKTFEKNYASKEMTRHAFQEAKEKADHCLEDPDLYLFQHENSRPKFFQDATVVWSKKIELLQAECQKLEEKIKMAPSSSLELEQVRNKKLDECNKIQKAMDAMETMKAAELALTEATKMAWSRGEKDVSNAEASDSLSHSFIDHKGKADAVFKKAQQKETLLTKGLDHVCEEYLKFCDLIMERRRTPEWLSQLETQLQTIHESWDHAKILTREIDDLWKKAENCIQVARENKTTWVRNLLRLAGSATGDFSLGKATKKDGETLGRIWLGMRTYKDKEGFEVSCDGLRRWRGLSPKPNLKLYQMNFERRSDPNKRWQGEEQDGGITWGNGHLTIVNPHVEDDHGSFMSRKFLDLTSVQLKHAYDEKKSELKIKAIQLSNTAYQIQEGLKEAKLQWRAAASFENREEEVIRLQQEIELFEKEHKKAWEEALEAYQHGYEVASEEEKTWWFMEQRVAQCQSRQIEQEPEEMIALWDESNIVVKHLSAKLKKESKTVFHIYDIMPKFKSLLKSFWLKKGMEIYHWQQVHRARSLYIKAGKELSIVHRKVKKVFEQSLDRHEKAWERIIQKLEEVIFSFNRVIIEYEAVLQINKRDPSQEFIWRRDVETIRDTKNQCIAKQMLSKAHQAMARFYEKNNSVLTVKALTPQERECFLISSQEENRNELKKLKEAEVFLKDNLQGVSEKRNDLRFWWKRELQGLQDLKKDIFLRRDTLQVSQATYTANQRFNEATFFLGNSLDTYVVEKIQEAAMSAWHKVIDNIDLNQYLPQNRTSLPWQNTGLEQLLEQRFQEAQKSVQQDKIIVATREAFLIGEIFQRSYQRAMNASVATQTVLLEQTLQQGSTVAAAWNRMIQESKKGIQLTSQQKNNSWWQEQLRIATTKKEESCLLWRSLMIKKQETNNNTELTAQERLRAQIKEKENQRKRK